MESGGAAVGAESILNSNAKAKGEFETGSGAMAVTGRAEESTFDPLEILRRVRGTSGTGDVPASALRRAPVPDFVREGRAGPPAAFVHRAERLPRESATRPAGPATLQALAELQEELAAAYSRIAEQDVLLRELEEDNQLLQARSRAHLARQREWEMDRRDLAHEIALLKKALREHGGDSGSVSTSTQPGSTARHGRSERRASTPFGYGISSRNDDARSVSTLPTSFLQNGKRNFSSRTPPPRLRQVQNHSPDGPVQDSEQSRQARVPSMSSFASAASLAKLKRNHNRTSVELG